MDVMLRVMIRGMQYRLYIIFSVALNILSLSSNDLIKTLSSLLQAGLETCFPEFLIYFPGQFSDTFIVFFKCQKNPPNKQKKIQAIEMKFEAVRFRLHDFPPLLISMMI